MLRERRSSVIVCCLMLALSGRVARAQTPAHSFDQLGVRVDPGDTVTVAQVSGDNVTGTVLSLSTSVLTLLVAGARRDFQEPSVVTIRQRHGDPLGNGALWGAGIGAAALLSVARAGVGADGPWSAKNTANMTYVAGLGCGVGVAIDAMIKGHWTLYAKPAPASRVAVVPLAGGSRRGVVVAVRF